MRKYKLKELRELVRLGVAENYTNKPSEYIYTLRRLEKVGYSTGVYGINGGWAFSLREFCRVYWVKVRHYGIMELYAPNKSAIYAVLGRYHVIKIVEV